MAQENRIHTSISIYKVECSVYKYTEHYRQTKNTSSIFNSVKKVNSIHFFYPHFVCRYNIIFYFNNPLNLLYLLYFILLFCEKTLYRIYPLLYSYFISNLSSISDNFSLSPLSNVGHFSLQTTRNRFFALHLHCLLKNFRQSS